MEQGRREMKPPPQQQPENQLQNHPPPPPQKCPRCDSINTKFCYYNNYSLSQPRYFCKSCRRYWTQGGTLRNVPVGGGCRKAKRVKTSSSIGGNISRPQLPPLPPPPGGTAPCFSGGGFFPSLAAMNTFPQPHATFGSSSSGLSLFQGFNFPPLTSQLPPQSQPQTDFYQMTNRPLGFWNQTLINNDSSGSNPNSNPIAGTSLNPNPFPDFQGYDAPSS